MSDHRGPDPSLLSVRYEVRASDLWRWTDAVEDESVDRFLTAFAGLGQAECRGVRAGLGESELTTLVTYAQRCALAAVRTRDVRHVVKAYDAISAISLDAVPDPRDVAMVAMLVTYAGQELDGRVSETVAAAVGRADPETAELLTDYLAEGIDLVEDCGYREVDSPGGRIFVGDEGETFRSRADLVTAAWSAAHAFEADRYQVRSIGIGQQLNSVWLGDDAQPAAVAAAERLTGCAVVDCYLRDAQVWHAVTVYLAEAASDHDAVAIASAAEMINFARVPQFGVAVDQLCAVVHAMTPNAEVQPVEDIASLERFRPAITAILERETR